MASQGPLYPGTSTSLANAGTSEDSNAWLNPTNVGADDTSEAAITAATYDSPDIGELLVASNFGLSVSGTVDGIVVEIMRRNSAGAASDNRVQLATGTTFADLVGTNKANTALDWPTAEALATYGGAADTWTAGLTAAQVNAAGFAVFLSVQADAANTDIQVDYIRVTVTYTPPTNTTVTPGVASLTTATFAPTVTATANQTVTPGVASLATATFAATVTATAHQTVIPPVLALALATFAPTVTVEAAGVTVTPTTASLALSAFAPTVAVSDNKSVMPGIATLALSTFAPNVTATDHKTVTPSVAAISLAAFVPTVTATAHQTVIPGTASLSLTGFAPTVTGGAGLTVTPAAATLALSAFAPSVSLTDNQLVTPEAASLTLAAFAATILTPRSVTPGMAALSLTGFAPSIAIGSASDVLVTPGPLALELTGYAPLVSTAFRGIRATIEQVGPSAEITTAVRIRADIDMT
jgi:hypothetical protein